MKVKVEYSAMLHVNCKNGALIDIDDGITVEMLMLKVGIKQHHIRFIISSVNGKTVKHNEILKNDDVVFLLILAGGG